LSPAVTKAILVGERYDGQLLRDLDQATALSWRHQSQIWAEFVQRFVFAVPQS
jgi:hypothetical protein